MWLNPAPEPPASAYAATPSAATQTASAAMTPLRLIPFASLSAPFMRSPGTGAVAPGHPRGTYVAESRAVFSGDRGSQMRGDHALDLGSARPALDAVDDPLALHEYERRHGSNAEPLGEVWLFVNVDAHDAEPRALLPREVREQALHPACGARTLGREEDEQRLRIVAH